MRNTDLFKLAGILKRYAEDYEVISQIADDIVGEFIEDEDAKGWFYNIADITSPDKYDEHSIS